MSHELRPYPEYKNSGLPWAPRIPNHWKIKRAKHLFSCIDNRSKTGTEERLTVSAKHGVVPRSTMKVTMFEAKSYIGHKLCWPGDLVINSLWAWSHGLGVARHHGLISSAYGVYRLNHNLLAYSNFIHHLVRSKAYHWELRTRSKGVWISRLQLTDDSFLRSPILLPSEDEAKAITRFIGETNRKVNAFIRNRRRLIEVLNEQKQAIINQAVTRGLDPDVPLKPSGSDWIGVIPKHWEATTLGRLVTTFKTGPFGSILHQSDYISGGTPLINPVHMSGGRITPDVNCAVDDATFHRLREYALAEGDIVFSRRGELGRCALVRKEESGWLIGTGSIRARLIPNMVNKDFLIAALHGRWVAEYLSLMSVGATMQSLNTGILSRLPLPLPPINEQMRIPELIKDESALVDKAVAKAKHEIELVREYRTRLISEVVTGIVDVRHLAPPPGSEDLEESVEALEPLDEATDELDEDAFAGQVDV